MSNSQVTDPPQDGRSQTVGVNSQEEENELERDT